MAINSFKEKIIKCKEPNQCLGDLLFIHGFCVDYSYMLAASDLAKYFNIYMINLPGHGDNTDNVRKSDMTLYSYCDYVVKYVNERNLNNFYLMGHSMGGAIASLVENKLKNRIKKLILVSPHNVAALFMGLKGLSVFYVKNMHQKYQLLDHLYKEYRCYLEDPEWVLMNENQLKFQLAHWKEMKTLFRHLSSIRTLCAIRKAQKNISVPTLLLVGTYDRIISAKHTIKGFKRYIPNVEIYTFENSGHLPFEEEKELFVSKVVEFASK